MKHLTILSFVLGVLVTPVQAQTQTPARNQPQTQGFNGLFFDRSQTAPPSSYQGPGYQPSFQANQSPGSQPPRATTKTTKKTYATHHVKKHRTPAAPAAT